MVLTLPLLSFAASRLTGNSATPGCGAQEIRDEADPGQVQSCFTLGRLDIAFQTEKKGPPTVGIVLTDPRGRRIGFDPILKSGFQELPQAEGYIDCDAPGTEGTCTGVIQVCGPVSGTYKLEIIAVQTTAYSLRVSGRSQEVRGKNHDLQVSDSDAEINNVAIQKGSRDMVILNYSRDLSSRVAFQRQAPVPVAGNGAVSSAGGNTGEAPAPESLHNDVN